MLSITREISTRKDVLADMLIYFILHVPLLFDILHKRICSYVHADALI